MYGSQKQDDDNAYPLQLGRYRIIDRIDAGGMAEVFRATAVNEKGQQQEVALKVILPSFARDKKYTTMLRNEAELASMLQHPNIVQMLELGNDRGTYFVAMEYVDGKNLRHILDKWPAPVHPATQTPNGFRIDTSSLGPGPGCRKQAQSPGCCALPLHRRR